jgi:UDP-3-O-[3-hydroxymyristoyl] glucosamine N-acyltransferase
MKGEARAKSLSFTLAELVERFGGELVGDANLHVEQVATLETARENQIAFLANSKYRSQLAATRAGALILGRAERDLIDRPRIVCDNPYAYFARVSALFNPELRPLPGIHASAVVDPSAQIATSASIGACVTIGSGVEVGEFSVIAAGCHLAPGVRIGAQCYLHASVVIYARCEIGDRAMLHSGVVIGADGFGIAQDGDRWLKIPQIGRVLIGRDVEVGANTTIDRGALDDTVIEDGVKLDNQIQIGHNVRIGAHTAIAGCVGIAGSTRIGAHCRIGGAAMIIGHLEISDHVDISAGTMVMKSIKKPGTYTAVYPLAEHQEWRRNALHLRHLDQLANHIAELEARLRKLENPTS